MSRARIAWRCAVPIAASALMATVTAFASGGNAAIPLLVQEHAELSSMSAVRAGDRRLFGREGELEL